MIDSHIHLDADQYADVAGLIKRAREAGVKAVVAVACEKELKQGIRAAFPKAVIGVINTRPKGPCFDTDVDLNEVERAIEWLLRR